MFRLGLEQQQKAARQAPVLLLGREPTDTEADAAHALFSHPVYLQLTEFAGWSNEAYRAWVADAALRLFRSPPHDPED